MTIMGPSGDVLACVLEKIAMASKTHLPTSSIPIARTLAGVWVEMTAP